MEQLKPFELIQTLSAPAAACAARGLSHSVAKFGTFCKFCNFLGNHRQFPRNVYVHMQSGPL